MENKQFKAESKRLLDLMINSIYTNKEIFLRELISNASDAIDKLYYRSLTDKNVKVNKDDLYIRVTPNKEARTLTIEDNGCGMSKDELEENLGTIAKSGSLAFKEAAKAKENAEKDDDVNIIGQFGVGFYSAFMVASKVRVESKCYGAEKAYAWESEGAEGYTIDECDKLDFGTKIILTLKADTDDEKYSDFLAEYKIEELIRKYSDYIRYPIKMKVEHEHEVEQPEGEKKEPKFEKVRHDEILNSMIPIWKKNKSEVSDEDYNNFYQEKFGDYQKPLKVIRTSVEGDVSYTALLYIPSHTPYDYYTKDFKRGLQLYSNGVLIMDKCEDLLPDCYGFVRGLVDSPDLSLNISREMLQHDRQLKIIAKNLDKKIKSELLDMLHKNREDYEKFFTTFGTTLKFGVYNDFGLNKDNLKDLLMFHSSTENKLVTLDEYVDRMKEGQDKIYYACGETVDKIELLPQVEAVKEKGYEILYLTENIDEFVVQVLMEHKEKKFINVCANDVDLDTDEEKEALKKENEENKDMFTLMKETIGEGVQEVRFTHRLKNHPVCLTSEGALSVEMEKVINSMPNDQKVKAQTALEINDSHPIAQKIKDLYANDKEELKKYTQVLYAQARLIEGLPVENPTQISNLICEIIAK
ncbi:chaperone protein HtpG [Clostridium sp. CAG:245]|jgi:chaperone protein htpG|nr:chaperone protein HtpG [Clostridium sp. CAG:245]